MKMPQKAKIARAGNTNSEKRAPKQKHKKTKNKTL
jgi:hypothetical protein